MQSITRAHTLSTHSPQQAGRHRKRDFESHKKFRGEKREKQSK
jgi:hypothetical protein